MKNIFIIFIYLAILLPGEAFSGQAESFTLDNGMQVVVVPNHRIPSITHMVWYKTGAYDEVEGKSGLAHYLEHLMFKGTKELKSGEFSKIIAINGGNDNAMTSYDYTAYFQSIAKENLELVMKLEADRMQNLSLEEQEAIKERDVILEERSESLDNDPGEILKEKMRAALFPDMPYGKSVIGWRGDMEKLTLDDAMEFYKKYYTPNNAILVVAGDVKPEEVKELAEKYYGEIPKKEIPERNLKSFEGKIKTDMVTLKDQKINSPEWRRFYIAPSLNSKQNKEMALPLVVLSEILGGGDTSRLYEKLVVQEKVAAKAYTSYDEMSLSDSIFSIYVLPKKNREIKKIAELVEDELQEIMENGVSEEEIKRAKNSLKAESIYARDSLSRLGFIYGQAIASGLDKEYIDEFPRYIDNVKDSEIKKAAELVFSQNKFVTGKLIK